MSPLTTNEKVIQDAFNDRRIAAARFVALVEYVEEAFRLNGLELPEDPPPNLDEARRIASARSLAEQAAEYEERQRRAKLAALHPPPRTSGDGSREIRPQPGDPWDKAFLTERIRSARGAQAARHKQMETAGKVTGDADRHAATQSIREEIYRRMKERGILP